MVLAPKFRIIHRSSSRPQKQRQSRAEAEQKQPKSTPPSIHPSIHCFPRTPNITRTYFLFFLSLPHPFSVQVPHSFPSFQPLDYPPLLFLLLSSPPSRHLWYFTSYLFASLLHHSSPSLRPNFRSSKLSENTQPLPPPLSLLHSSLLLLPFFYSFFNFNPFPLFPTFLPFPPRNQTNLTTTNKPPSLVQSGPDRGPSYHSAFSGLSSRRCTRS